MLAFTAKTLISPTSVVERPLLLVENGIIAEIASREMAAVPVGITPTDLGDVMLAPGYIDLHIHGGAGFDVMDDTVDALPAIERALARHGVTSYYPTTVTAPMDLTLRALERLAEAIEHRPERPSRACPVGVHLEGPFISHVRKGMHPTQNLLPPTLETFDRLWQASRGCVRMMTIAAEMDGALELI